jgi:hypothetical protein
MLYDEDQRVPGFPEIAILSNEKVDGKFIGVAAAGCAVCPSGLNGRHQLSDS